MPIHLNPFRLYRGTLCLNHGLLVEMLRMTQRFWDAYRHLLDINGKRESDIKELRILMGKMGLKPDEQKMADKKRFKIIQSVSKEFDDGLRDIDGMFESLGIIIIDDETLLWKTVNELRDLYFRVRKIRHIPDHISFTIQQALYPLMHRMGDIQRHANLVAKAHSRGFTKLEDLSIVSNRGERRRIRAQTIELDHIRNRIGPLRHYIETLSIAKDQGNIHEARDRTRELLELYHLEVEDLQHILHEGDILIRRTEQLFNAIEHEAAILNEKSIRRKAESYKKKFSRIHDKLEKLTFRESLEINILLKGIPKPAVQAAQVPAGAVPQHT